MVDCAHVARRQTEGPHGACARNRPVESPDVTNSAHRRVGGGRHPGLHPHRVDPPLRLRPHAGVRAASSLSKTKADLAQAKKELKALQAKLDKLAKQQADAEDDLETTKIRIDEVQTKIDAAEDDLAGLRAQLAGRLAEMYKNRDSDATITFLNVLFAGDDTSLTAIVERLTMVTHIAQADTKLVNSVVGRVRELKSLRADLSAQKAAEKKKTAKYDAARDKTLNSLENSKDDYNRLRKRVATLQEEARQARRGSAQGRGGPQGRRGRGAAAAKKKTTGTTTRRTTPTTESRPPVVIADFVFPVDGPNSFSNTFGAPRSGGRAHQGCDIMTARNTPLVAVVDGVITSTNPYDCGLGGITIHLRGGNGTVYYYAHLVLDQGRHPGGSTGERRPGDRLRREHRQCERRRGAPPLRDPAQRRGRDQSLSDPDQVPVAEERSSSSAGDRFGQFLPFGVGGHQLLLDGRQLLAGRVEELVVGDVDGVAEQGRQLLLALLQGEHRLLGLAIAALQILALLVAQPRRTGPGRGGRLRADRDGRRRRSGRRGGHHGGARRHPAPSSTGSTPSRRGSGPPGRP